MHRQSASATAVTWKGKGKASRTCMRADAVLGIIGMGGPDARGRLLAVRLSEILHGFQRDRIATIYSMSPEETDEGLTQLTTATGSDTAGRSGGRQARIAAEPDMRNAWT